MGSWPPLVYQLFLDHYIPASNPPLHWFEFLLMLLIGGLDALEVCGVVPFRENQGLRGPVAWRLMRSCPIGIADRWRGSWKDAKVQIQP